MFKIIFDQIAFKNIGMGEYDKLSSVGVWVLFLLVSGIELPPVAEM